MHILFLEPDTDGHHASYVGSLAAYVGSRRPEVRATFAVDERILDAVDPAAREHLATQPHLRVLAIPRRELDKRRFPDPVRQGMVHWALAARLLSRTRADHAHFLHADHILLPLTLRRRMPRRAAVSGILFRPVTHYGELGAPPAGWREKKKVRIKHLLYRGALANACLARLFSLDPAFPEYADRSYGASGRVVYLPEPVFWPRSAPSGPKPDMLRFCGGERTLFVIFGALTVRKGVREVLRAARLLDPRMAASIGILFAGTLHPDLRGPFLADFRDAVAACPNLALHLEDRFIQPAELAGLVRHSDVVLAPYRRHVGSSSVLYWAAAAGKPVIASDYGLMGWQVRQFGLGTLIRTPGPAALAEAMTRAGRSGPAGMARPSGQRAFCAGHSPADFARTIIDGITASAVRDPC